MKQAFIDVGSNTIRMLLHDISTADRYFRKVTRLAGGADRTGALSAQSMERTLAGLAEFCEVLRQEQPERVIAVGTAALRRAPNAGQFLAQARERVGLSIEIIDGQREASLSCLGMLEVLNPLPERALLFDIGGGSTEFILFGHSVDHQSSLDIGVVTLCDSLPDTQQRMGQISAKLDCFFRSEEWQRWTTPHQPYSVVGTAGTVTTLAALKLEMQRYAADRVNNLVLEKEWLVKLREKLQIMSPDQRLKLPGMEAGREEVILPGIELVLAILDKTDKPFLHVSDAGLLEGLLLEAQQRAV